MPNCLCSLWGLIVVSLLCCNLPVQAQFLPADVGTAVNGFQDDFEGTTLNPNWVVRGMPVFSVSGGSLRGTSTAGDPNHLLYEAGGHDNITLALVRVAN